MIPAVLEAAAAAVALLTQKEGAVVEAGAEVQVTVEAGAKG